MQSRRRRLVALKKSRDIFRRPPWREYCGSDGPLCVTSFAGYVSHPRILGEGAARSRGLHVFQCGGFRQHGLVICREECVFVLGQPRPCAANLVFFYWEKSSRRAAQRPDPAKPCWCCLKRPWATPSLR